MEKSGQPRIWTVIAMMPAAAFSMIAASALVGMIAAVLVLMDDGSASVDSIMENPLVVMAMLVMSQIGLLLSVGLGVGLSKVPVRERLSLNPVTIRPTRWVLLILSTIGSACLISSFLDPPEYMAEFIKLLETQSLSFSILFIVIGSVMPGFIEEFLCRGYVQGRLLKRVSPVLAVGVSSVYFTALHMDPTYFTYLIPLSIWLGLLHYHYKSIIPCIVCHVANNLVAFSMVVAQIHFPEQFAVFERFPIHYGFIAFFIVGLITMFKEKKSRD